jgi:hypothetical protein
MQGDSWWRTARLAFQCVGILYGDVGTSPLYVYSTAFDHGVGHPDDILGVLSLIIYSFLLFTVIKIVFVALHANDDGDGQLITLLLVFFFNGRTARALLIIFTSSLIIVLGLLAYLHTHSCTGNYILFHFDKNRAYTIAKPNRISWLFRSTYRRNICTLLFDFEARQGEPDP